VNTFAANHEQSAALGYWKTVDDETGKVRSIMKITLTQNNRLQGQVVKTFPLPGEDPNRRCEKCEGADKNKPILGLVVMQGLTWDGDEWSGGKILDPLNGNAYKCIVKAADDGKTLMVRGYIGLPLLGRTQTWIKDKGL